MRSSAETAGRNPGRSQTWRLTRGAASAGSEVGPSRHRIMLPVASGRVESATWKRRFVLLIRGVEI